MSLFARFLSGALCASLLTGVAAAQGGTPPPFQAWVNPQTGSNLTGAVNDSTRPYLTLGAAINAVSSAVGGTQQGVVYGMPGLYSDVAGANGEVFPIQMQDRVHVQGLGAKECVVRNTNGAQRTRWAPMNPNGGNRSMQITFDLSGLRNTVPTSLEGFTLQGGTTQVATHAEVPQMARISNCVFDMRLGGEDNLIGPEFGILMVPSWDETNGGIYNPLDYHIFNNTFIQGYQRTGAVGDNEVTVPQAVAICNVNDWRGAGGFDDPNRTARGVSALNIQNNLIRALPGQAAMAFLGIDNSDTTVALGTTPGASNAFDPLAVGGLDATGIFRSNIVGIIPVPAVPINGGPGGGSDPGFVGEMISQTQFLQLQNPFVRDWRVLPDSVLLDAGSGPLALGATSVLGAANGVTYSELNASGVRAFDWDGDGHGNPRLRGAEMDIGFDEIDALAIAGCYGNDSKSHGQTWHPTLRNGNINRTHITPAPSIVTYVLTTRFVTPGLGWTFSPGTVPGLPAAGLGTLYLDLSAGFSQQNLGATTTSNWTNPVDGATHTFAQLIVPSNDFGPAHFPFHLNGQSLVPLAQGGGLSNLQFEIY